ncbi:MAG: hypothetical protein K8I00_02450, partial [Candidatus Omnitrophica bacterium]|nr:hypothetical protein [Candidatus Omnitrophota bacterium]
MLFRSRQFRVLCQKVVGPVLTAFVALCLLPVPGWTRGQPQAEFRLPVPGTMVSFSEDFNPVLMKGLRIDPDNPLRFEFVIDPGDTDLTPAQFEQETAKVVKYFFAALTIPEKDMWVNLSPYERQRVIANEFAKTRMGRDLLGQDYLLKQVTASVMYPEKEHGRAFWQRVFHRAQEEFGTTDIPVDTFNKAGIVPETAVVHAEKSAAYVLE